ncbi:MAG: hypothetical protein JKY66_08165 [Spongiibacteraceae bacterium]|nr:hypothetical protein [Spongiibacteraceae bacterium]
MDSNFGQGEFNDGISQKMHKLNRQGVFSLSYLPNENKISTWQDGRPFVLSGGENLFGIFDKNGLVVGGEINGGIEGSDLNFVFFSEDYVYVFEWSGIEGYRYRRSF